MDLLPFPVRRIRAYRPGLVGPPSDPEPPPDPDVLPFQPDPPRVVDVEPVDDDHFRLVAGE
jgi:hypothetical protein